MGVWWGEGVGRGGYGEGCGVGRSVEWRGGGVEKGEGVTRRMI